MRTLHLSEIVVLLGAMPLSCSTAAPSSVQSEPLPPEAAAKPLPSPEEVSTLLPHTVLPKAFAIDALAKEKSKTLIIAPMMLTVALVTRPRAEVRQGPGGQYELLDLVLQQGAKVLVMDQSGVWRKIVVRGTWERGWVHAQSLSKPVSSSKSLTMSSVYLPTVTTTNRVEEVFAFPTRRRLKVEIAKATIFQALRQDEFGSLVWLSSTNSVMWIAKKDIQ